MTLFRDLIEIPERVHRDDFVLRLSEGVTRPAETLANYVVTPQLAGAFDRALELIRGALASSSSKAAYLHGSFGSGKSHFMAVLHLLLQQNAAARALEGLEGAVTKHEEWLGGKRFLLVPYHMIGQPSMEAAVLGGYVRRVAELHPTAPAPGVYRAEGLFADARKLRERLGDEAFFAGLNEAASGGGGGGGWGDLSASWDGAGFAAALAAPMGSEERSRLVGALVDAFFRGYREVARGSEAAFVSLDDGLSILSRHARELGYDGLILFLDELILWLATHAADFAFLSEEGPKVAKLVEAETADRPIPIVSFVARQRDLRELVGDRVTGADQLGFADTLQWWEARFEKITLEDRNLPEIAARRILRPRSEAARREIELAYAETEKVRREVFETLLTPRADRSVFRQVYPFSPALVETLVAVSSLLQRERTALKVMLQLLVDQRETLELGQLVPVGDLFDVIAEGDEPFTEGMRHHFENARRLYHQKLLPLLERQRGVAKREVEALPPGDAAARAFLADDRLAKTLLLAALVPEVEVLKGLTAARLAALNHGSIRTPIEGREVQEVLRRCRSWATEVGELRIGDDPNNPTITLRLAAVDTEGILANAERIDNTGNRRRKIRELLFGALGIEDRDEHALQHEISWRGTRRSFEVIFANARELPDASLATRGEERKVVIDFPFDEPGYTPADDLARLDTYRRDRGRARTLIWLPSFLSASAQRDLGTLVKLDYVLAGERLRDYAGHLSPIDQASARELLRNQQSQLRHQLVRFLEGAYGVESPPPGSIDEAHAPAEHFQSLDPAFEPRPPARANLRAALESLLDQQCASQYPAHPSFGMEVKPAVLRRVYEQVARAVQEPEGRVAVEKTLRPAMSQIAVPLRLGEMGETHFVLGRHWFSRFDRLDKPLSVDELRREIDEPERMGLPEGAQNLVILVYADQANLAFRRHGGAWPAKLEGLPGDLELREEELPAQEVWKTAIDRAGKIFGIAISPLRNARNAGELAAALGEAAEGAVEACAGLVERLEGVGRELSIAGSDARRLHTARATAALLRSLCAGSGKGRIERLAEVEPDTSPEAMGTSLRKAQSVLDTLQGTKWPLFASIARLPGERAGVAERIGREVADAVAADEYAVGLAAKLQALENEAIELLAPPPAPYEPPRDAPGIETGTRVAATLREGSYEDLDRDRLRTVVAELENLLDDEPAARLSVLWKLHREGGA